jgi:hypothetical protein
VHVSTCTRVAMADEMDSGNIGKNCTGTYGLVFSGLKIHKWLASTSEILQGKKSVKSFIV